LRRPAEYFFVRIKTIKLFLIISTFSPLLTLFMKEQKIQKMEWTQLLKRQRLGKHEEEEKITARTCFQQDFDRIVFSSPFRRLKDKTQVYSLSKNDYIRTRLTHSIEVSCVGRSLGTAVGEKIIEKYPQLKDNQYSASDFGSIVCAACLAHDIGNPPFGHAGEDAIQSGFHKWNEHNQNVNLSELKRKDFEKFEGNAQGFRILTRLEMSDREGGMQLTYPTLATFTKYPKESAIPQHIIDSYLGISIKKYGFFQSEKQLFGEIAQSLGLIRRYDNVALWSRHPLAFLVEAADDICYRIVDLEDAYRIGFITFKTAKKLLNKIANKHKYEITKKAIREEEQIKYLRAIVINKLIQEVRTIFLDKEDDILEGKFDDELLNCLQDETRDSLQKIKEKTNKKVFNAADVVKIQIAGYEVLSNLFSEFADAVLNDKRKGKSKLLLEILPQEYRPKNGDSEYNKILKVTDYISGMTDSYATSLFQTIKGISFQT
jgi:dGTPase